MKLAMYQNYSKSGFVWTLVSVIVMCCGGLALWFGQILPGTRKDQAVGYAPMVLAKGEESISGTVESSIGQADARVETAKRYLEKYKSPLVPFAQMIVDLSDTYDLDYRLILAIGQQESNLCKKIPVNSHNCWGYGIHKKGSLGFDSYELALKSYTAYLKREYFDKGYDTIEKIERKYNPSSNGSWAYGVNFFMKKIESGDF